MPEKRGRVKVNARRWITVAGTVVVLGGGAVAWAATRSSDPVYRLATASPAEVSSVLSATGTIQSVNQATLSFPVSGQVSAVNVQVGQQVTPGQVLATLDTTTLAGQVSSAQARAAAAQAKLATDENSQTAAAAPPAGGGSGTSSGAAGGRSPAAGGGRPAGPPAALTSGQTAVEKAQRQVDADLSADNSAISKEKAACAAATGTSPAAYTRSSSTPSPSPDPPGTSAAPTTSAPESSAPDDGGSGSGGSTSACTTAIQQVLDDQTRTASDEKSLADAENGLTKALDQAAASSTSSGGSSSAPSGSSAGSSGRTGSSSGSSSGGRATAPASAAQLAADQASVDATNADLGAATQNLSAATLTSPIAGTVAQVGLTTGQAVAGASTQSDIVVIGPGSDEVTTTVSDLQVRQVHPGETATITPDGTTLRLSGQVTQVGILGSASSSGSVAYPVTISLDQTSQQLFAGATAAVSINIGSANASVAVPTSAVHAVGARQVVTVLRNGKTTSVPVTVGVVGATMTEVQSGLRPGDQVVIADLSAPLPTSNNLRLGGGGLGGARPGGGGAGGGGGAVRPGG